MARAKFAMDGETFYGIVINCPGCRTMGLLGKHVLPVRWLPPGRAESPNAQGKPHWDFDGNLEWPTLAPSVLATIDSPHLHLVCHSFVRDGRIEYLNDCTHELAGKTIDLPDFEPRKFRLSELE